MPRSLKLLRTHRQALPNLAVSPGPQVPPSLLRASFRQTGNPEGVRTSQEQSLSAGPRPLLQTEHLSRIVGGTCLVFTNDPRIV